MVTDQAQLECLRLTNMIERMLQSIKPTLEPDVFHFLLQAIAAVIHRQARQDRDMGRRSSK